MRDTPAPRSPAVQEQPVDSPEGGRAASFQREFPLLDWGCQFEQAPEDLLGLGPGEGGACAKVRTVAEREVRPGLPAQVQTVWVGERGRVTVGCAKAYQHLLASSDGRFAERRVASGYAGGELHGTVVTQNFLDSSRQLVGAAP